MSRIKCYRQKSMDLRKQGESFALEFCGFVFSITRAERRQFREVAQFLS
jgi:hypothetical protein